ncbi:MAG: hypothetical protein ACREJP_01805, partial [Candidatus Methylomirabilales bacterium]
MNRRTTGGEYGEAGLLHSFLVVTRPAQVPGEAAAGPYWIGMGAAWGVATRQLQGRLPSGTLKLMESLLGDLGAKALAGQLFSEPGGST